MEKILDDFYGTFPYPWRPMRLDVLADPEFPSRFLRQDLGDYRGERIQRVRSIWVAGCGTNQALITALRFPEAEVLGTDASARSLEICAENAAAVGAGNLTLTQEGIASAGYENRFDYVVCTGVIHHNPEPEKCLARLAAALRPTGVLELMVYNRFHRLGPTAFQAAMRVFEDDPHTTGRQADRLDLAGRLAAAVPKGSVLATDLADYDNPSDAAWADTWINPCEHSYTVDGLWAMADGCGLVVQTPTPSGLGDAATVDAGWFLDLADADLRARYAALPDRARWQAVNLLRHDRSPMLWFYLTPAAAGPRVSEAERAEAFLSTVFRGERTERRGFVLDGAGGYRAVPRATPFPSGAPPEDVRGVHDAVDGRRTMREIFSELGLDQTRDAVNRARVRLTTSAYPFLRAC